MRPIVIASRKSDLARIQAQAVGANLGQSFQDLVIRYHYRASLGDQNLNDPLWKMPEKGVFTEDFHQGLVSGEFDMVVHSWKDLPTQDREGTEIFCTLPREDMRDVILIKKKSWLKVKETGFLRVFSSSPRRIYNIEPFLKEYLPGKIHKVEFESVRGNVQTRCQKLLQFEELDGLVMAKAAIDRMLAAKEDEFSHGREIIRETLEQCLWVVIPLCANPAAAAQGALAIEIRENDLFLKEKLSHIACSATYKAVKEERRILKNYGGGCHQKIGVSCLERDYGQITFLKGQTEDKEVLNRASLDRFQNYKKVESEKKLFPLLGEGHWFEREKIDSQSLNVFRNRFLWVVRFEAWPEGLKSENVTCVWTSGLKTWKKMAEKGLWVNGCAESLGEQEDERLQYFFGRQPSWIKLTHEEGFKDINKEIHVTYRLQEKNISEDLSQRTHFYWRSSSLFEKALREFPEIRDKNHFCGPGNTYKIIKKFISHPIGVFLNWDEWHRALTLEDE